MASAFPDFIPDCLKYALEKSFRVVWLFSHVMLPWSTHPISPVFRGRSYFAFTVHLPSRTTGRNNL